MSTNSTAAIQFLKSSIANYNCEFREGDILTLIEPTSFDNAWVLGPEMFIDGDNTIVFDSYNFSESVGAPYITGNVSENFHVGIKLKNLTHRHKNKIFLVSRFEKAQ